MRKKVGIIIFLITILISINVSAKYKFNKNIEYQLFANHFHFYTEVNSTYIEQKNNEANLTLTIKNYNSDTEYNEFDTNYSIEVNASKYKTTIVDSNNGLLEGNSKKTNTINIKFEPISSTNLTLEESVTIKVTTSSPYIKTENINIVIKNSDILYYVGVVNGGYSTNIDGTGIVGWQSLAAENFFLDINEIEVQDYAVGTMNFSKAYNSSTGVLTLNRTSIQGDGFIIQFKANIYASFQPVLVGAIEGGYTASIDCTGVSEWQNRTVDDFILDVKWVDLPDEIKGTMTFKKSYNASTGVLTITRSSITGNGTVTFGANVYTTRFPSQVTSLASEASLENI